MLVAQAPALLPGAVSASVGLGTGSASFSCDGCGSQRSSGLAAQLGLGIAVRPSIVLSADVNRWTTDYADSRGSANARMLFVSAAAQWYPRSTSSLFVKGGVGMASIEDDVNRTALGRTDITASAPALVLGAGWSFPLRGGWAATPYASLNYSMKGTQSINGVASSQKFGGTLMHVGVAATTVNLLRKQPKHVAPAAPIVAAVDQDSVDRVRASEAAAVKREAEAAAARRTAEEAAVREAEAVAAARETEALRATIAIAVHFDFNRADLRQDTRQALDDKIPILRANPDLTVRITGHTDSRGPEEYNRRLGQRRAAGVRDYFVTQGVSADRVEIIGVGAERPICQEQDETCWSRNRRVEFEIVSGGATLRRPR
jgi:peptidoglycan-associated lipoprotein